FAIGQIRLGQAIESVDQEDGGATGRPLVETARIKPAVPDFGHALGTVVALRQVGVDGDQARGDWPSLKRDLPPAIKGARRLRGASSQGPRQGARAQGQQESRHRSPPGGVSRTQRAYGAVWISPPLRLERARSTPSAVSLLRDRMLPSQNR